MEEKYTAEEGYEVRQKENIVEVFYKDKLYLFWNEEWNVDCPEDLCWSRDISRVFNEGIKLGLELAKDKE